MDLSKRLPRSAWRAAAFEPSTASRQGRAEFRNGLHRQLDLEGPVSQTLYGALLFLHLADPAVVKDSLRRRIARLDDLIAKLEPIRGELAPRLSTGGEHLLGHIEQQRRLDRDWLKAFSPTSKRTEFATSPTRRNSPAPRRSGCAR